MYRKNIFDVNSGRNNNSLSVQIRVIGALILREMITRYGRKNIGFLWLFAEPIIFTLGVAGLWSLIKGHSVSSIPIVAFAVTGYSSILLWRNMPSRCMHSLEANLALMSHRYVTLLDIYISRLLLEIAGVTLSFLALATLFTFLDQMPYPENLLQVFLGWVMLAWFGVALALSVGPFSERFILVEKIWAPLTYLMFPLSGAAFVMDSVPSSVRDILLWLPMVHGIEYLREGYFGSVFHAHYDLAYMSVVSAFLTLFGLAQVRITSRFVVSA